MGLPDGVMSLISQFAFDDQPIVEVINGMQDRYHPLTPMMEVVKQEFGRFWRERDPSAIALRFRTSQGRFQPDVQPRVIEMDKELVCEMGTWIIYVQVIEVFADNARDYVGMDHFSPSEMNVVPTK